MEMSDQSVDLVEQDISTDLHYLFEQKGKEDGLAVDIETTGLDPRTASIAVVTLAVPGTSVTVDTRGIAENVANLLENGSIEKIIHNAAFESAFFLHHWSVRMEAVFCTKVAARIAGIERNPTLRFLTKNLFGVEISKEQRLSDWSARPLSHEQLAYAANDVRYLHDLRAELSWRLSTAGRSSLFEAAMRFLPSRSELALIGFPDVFAYEVQ